MSNDKPIITPWGGIVAIITMFALFMGFLQAVGMTTIGVQGVQINTLNESSKYLRVTSILDGTTKGYSLTIPKEYEIKDRGKWVFDNPITIEYDTTSFYSYMPVLTTTRTIQNFPYGKGGGILGIGCQAKRKTIYYNELGTPAQRLEIKISLKQNNNLLESIEPVVSFDSSQYMKFKDYDVEIIVPGWWSRGALPPTGDYVIISEKVFDEGEFEDNYLYQTFTLSNYPRWFNENSQCNTEYTDEEIFVTGFKTPKGITWTPPKTPSLTGVGDIKVLQDEVQFKHPLPTSASGMLILTFPKEFVGAKFVEFVREAIPKIKGIDGDFDFKDDVSKTWQVTVENVGNDGGNVAITVEVEGFYGSASAYISAGEVATIPIIVYATATDKDVETSGKVYVYAGKNTHSYDVKLSKSPDIDDEDDEDDDERPPIVKTEEPTVKFKNGMVVWSSSEKASWAVEVQGFDKSTIEFEFADSIKSIGGRGLLTDRYSTITENDADGVKGTFTRVRIASTLPFDVIDDKGNMVEENVKVYKMPTPTFVYIILIAVTLIGGGIVILLFNISKRDRKQKQKPKRR